MEKMHTPRKKNILRSLGPGFIIASVVLGPGSIAVASRTGSEYGYTFLWVVVISAVSMLIYTSMAARYGVLHKNTFLQGIATTYGRWFAGLISISVFIASISFQFGNNLGIGIAMEGLTGIPEKLWPWILTPLAILLIFFAKNLYKMLEKIMMVLVITMIVAFIINLFLVHPDVQAMATGFVPHSFSHKQLDVVAALVATTFSLSAAFYQAYLVQDKKLTRDDLQGSVRDSYMGVIMLALISLLVIITSAAALHPFGIKVRSAADMALQLEALFGSFAKYIFSLGLGAAAFSSLMVNAVIGGGLLADGLGKGGSMNDRFPRIFTIVILLTGMIVAIFFRGDLVYALIMAQGATMLGVPLIAAGMFLMLNNKKVMGDYRNNPIQNILAILGFILISIMVYYMYSRLTHLVAGH